MAFKTFAMVLILTIVGECQDIKKVAIRIPNIRPQYDDVHLCTSFRVDPTTEYYITSYEPHASMEIVHHMFIAGCKEPGSMAKVWNCANTTQLQQGLEFGGVCKSKNTHMGIIYMWARNATKLILPEGVGYEVGGCSDIHFIVMQIHYASVERFRKEETLTDTSGITMTYSTTPTPKIAAIFMLSSYGRILANTTEYFEISCTIREDVVMHPFAFRVHTHKLGLVVSGYKVTKKTPPFENWELIGKKDPQLPQMFYPVEKKMTLRKGNILASRCTMYNFRNRTVRHGLTNQDEMCNFYVMYWTEKKKPKQNFCMSIGPPYQYWYTNGLQLIPDADASSLPVGESAKELGFFDNPV